MACKEDVLIEKYLEQHSLVESNILSFNNFIQQRIQEIASEINSTIDNTEVEIKLGKVKMGKPSAIESDGSINVINPTSARLRNITYSAPVFIEISIKHGEHTDSAEVEVGRIPVIVKSETSQKTLSLL